MSDRSPNQPSETRANDSAQKQPRTPAVESRGITRWVIAVLLSLGMIVAYVDRSNISVALTVPEFKESFRLSDSERGMVNSAFFWSYALLQIPAGWVVDRYGVKFPYAIGFLFWTIVSAGTAMARSVPQLITLRVLLGMGESIVAPASNRWIRLNFEEKHRGLAVGIYMTGTKIGPAIGAPLAAWLVVAFNWQLMFVILALGGLVWLVPWLLIVRNENRPTGIEPGRKSAQPDVPFRAILASPVILGTVISTFCYMYFVHFCLTWMPAYFREQRGLSLSSMGFYTFFSFGGMAAVAVIAGWAADWMIARGGSPLNVRKGFTICGFLLAATELIGAQTRSPEVALFFAVFSLSGLGLATANYWALTQTLVPASAVGRIIGIQNCAASVSGIVAPLWTGWLVEKTGSYQPPMQTVWVLLVIGVASYLFLVRAKYAPMRKTA